ncbi:autotransporter domain-containing protein [Vulcanococcus sp.]|uniref:autotransporter family protein n=1 Tax=Vulcanococcus sp. TaxID=2856995 RepID=UPI0037D9D932
MYNIKNRLTCALITFQRIKHLAAFGASQATRAKLSNNSNYRDQASNEDTQQPHRTPSNVRNQRHSVLHRHCGDRRGHGFRLRQQSVCRNRKRDIEWNSLYLATTSCYASGVSCSSAPGLKNNSWWGNEKLAKSLAEATKDLLGLPNRDLSFYVAPGFVWESGDPDQTQNFVKANAAAWVRGYNGVQNFSADWNKNTGRGISTISILAYEAVAPRPIVVPPILVSNNGSPTNTTISLAAKALLPQFQGGTLTISAAGIVTDNFTLNGDPGNTIDATGNTAIFSGVFSDQAGTQGTIGFKNSGSTAADITLTTQSTYSGLTRIWDNTTVTSGADNVLPSATELLLYGNGTFNLNGRTQTIAAIGGAGIINLGTGTLTINLNDQFTRDSSADITGTTGGLIKDGSFTQALSGAMSYTGDTTVKAGTLVINGSSTSDTIIQPGATLGGTGVIRADVFNFGTVSPGLSIGTLTIDGGSYLQDSAATLAIEVAGAGQSDLLQLTGAGSGQVILLEGSLKLSSYQGAPITPGVVYTAVSVPTGTVGGDPSLSANTGGVAGTSSFQFVRDEDPNFTQLANGTATPDPNKLQFGWIQLKPDGTPVSTATPPGKPTIAAVKPTGGALTFAITGSTTTLQQQCTANTGNAAACQTSLTGGGSSGSNGRNPNNVSIAKAIDAGMSSVYAAVVQGTTGGTPIPTASGAQSGYTSNQALAAAVTPDFITVYGALFSIPTRAQLNQALHSITAEPYASMQSVALEAMEQFRTNALALSNGDKAIRLWTDADMCETSDGKLIPANREKIPSGCKPRKISQASRWSLLIDATNTQANLDGTNDLASLDYNIFQSTYGLQYDASKQWSIGGAFGYGQANLYNYEYANSTIDSNTYSAGAWAIYRPSDPWKITALVGYMNLQYDSNRNISFGGLNRTATADWSGNGFTTALKAEYDWILSADKAERNAIRLKPNTYLAYSLHSQGDITESGADALNLAIDGHSADSLIYGIGFTLETPIQLAKQTRLIPRLSVGYEHDFNGNTNEEHQLSASFAELPALGSVDVLGQNRGADDLNVALNLELETSDQFSLYAGVGGSFWSNGNELNYGGGLRWRFGGAPKASVLPTPVAQPQNIR